MSTKDAHKIDDAPSSSDNKHLCVERNLRRIDQEKLLINGQFLTTSRAHDDLICFSEGQKRNKIDGEQQKIQINQHQLEQLILIVHDLWNLLLDQHVIMLLI